MASLQTMLDLPASPQASPPASMRRASSFSMSAKRQRLEEEQSFVSKLIAEGTVVCEIEASNVSASPSKMLQGSTSHYTAPKAFHRENLRHSMKIKEAIVRVWDVLPKNSQRGICEDTYCKFYEAVLASFQPHMAPVTVAETVLVEWHRESPNNSTNMPEGVFSAGMFELLDRWTDTDNVNEYTKLAGKLWKLAKRLFKELKDKKENKPQYIQAVEQLVKKRQQELAEDRAKKEAEQERDVFARRHISDPTTTKAPDSPPPGTLARSMSISLPKDGPGSLRRRGSTFVIDPTLASIMPSPPTTAGGRRQSFRKRRPSTTASLTVNVNKQEVELHATNKETPSPEQKEGPNNKELESSTSSLNTSTCSNARRLSFRKRRGSFNASGSSVTSHKVNKEKEKLHDDEKGKDAAEGLQPQPSSSGGRQQRQGSTPNNNDNSGSQNYTPPIKPFSWVGGNDEFAGGGDTTKDLTVGGHNSTSSSTAGNKGNKRVASTGINGTTSSNNSLPNSRRGQHTGIGVYGGHTNPLNPSNNNSNNSTPKVEPPSINGVGATKNPKPTYIRPTPPQHFPPPQPPSAYTEVQRGVNSSKSSRRNPNSTSLSTPSLPQLGPFTLT